MREITKDEWTASVLSQPLVLVDFYADWCAPCKMQTPILEDIENEFGPLQVIKINADRETDLVVRYNVTSIPTLMLFKNGEKIWGLTGAKPKGVLVKEINPYV